MICGCVGLRTSFLHGMEYIHSRDPWVSEGSREGKKKNNNVSRQELALPKPPAQAPLPLDPEQQCRSNLSAGTDSPSASRTHPAGSRGQLLSRTQTDGCPLGKLWLTDSVPVVPGTRETGSRCSLGVPTGLTLSVLNELRRTHCV